MCASESSRWRALTSRRNHHLVHYLALLKSSNGREDWKYILLPSFSNSSNKTVGYLTNPKPVRILRGELYLRCVPTSIVAPQPASLWSLPLFCALCLSHSPVLEEGAGLLIRLTALLWLVLLSDLSECLLYLCLRGLITHSVFGFKGYRCLFSGYIYIPLFSALLGGEALLLTVASLLVVGRHFSVFSGIRLSFCPFGFPLLAPSDSWTWDTALDI